MYLAIIVANILIGFVTPAYSDNFATVSAFVSVIMLPVFVFQLFTREEKSTLKEQEITSTKQQGQGLIRFLLASSIFIPISILEISLLRAALFDDPNIGLALVLIFPFFAWAFIFFVYSVIKLVRTIKHSKNSKSLYVAILIGVLLLLAVIYLSAFNNISAFSNTIGYYAFYGSSVVGVTILILVLIDFIKRLSFKTKPIANAREHEEEGIQNKTEVDYNPLKKKAGIRLFIALLVLVPTFISLTKTYIQNPILIFPLGLSFIISIIVVIHSIGNLFVAYTSRSGRDNILTKDVV